MEKILLAGHTLEGYAVPTENTAILLIKAEHGFLGCGYFAVETAEKVGDAAVIVSGVKDFDGMLAAPVKRFSSAAARRGVVEGMSGRDALLKLL